MTNIVIEDLNLSGIDLLENEESYLSEISESEINLTGGFTFALFTAVAAGFAVGAGARKIHDYDKGILAWL